MRMAVAIVIPLFFATSALAQGTCDSQAVGKDGKPLSGAAKTAFVNKCKKDACEPKAVGSDGKPLAGAAKASFMKKCQNDAQSRLLPSTLRAKRERVTWAWDSPWPVGKLR
jgi:hypothetical protein